MVVVLDILAPDQSSWLMRHPAYQKIATNIIIAIIVAVSCEEEGSLVPPTLTTRSDPQSNVTIYLYIFLYNNKLRVQCPKNNRYKKR